MAAITDMSDLVNLATDGSGLFLPFIKLGRVSGAAAAAPVANRWTSLWQYEGMPAHGSVPGAVAAPTCTTAGALLCAAATGGETYKLADFVAMSNVIGVVWLMDRLLHIGGLDGTTAGAQNVGGSITRNTTGKGNMAWVEVYTQIGATPQTNVTVAYTGDNNGGGQTSPAFTVGGTALREAQRMIPIPLAAGDSGFAGVTSITLGGSTGTAGNFGVTIARPLKPVGIIVNGGCGSADCISAQPSLLDLDDDPCLMLAFFSNTTTVPDSISGNAFIIAK